TRDAERAQHLRRAGERLAGVLEGDARGVRGALRQQRRLGSRQGRERWCSVSGRDPRDVIIRPVVSEKSYAAFDENVYTFVVAPAANKIEIRRAVETIFNVRVTNVNTFNRKGKRKRNRRTGGWGSRPGSKRAVVSLAVGDRIEIFGS